MTMRAWTTGIACALLVAVLISALAWTSWHILRLERAEAKAYQKAVFEEGVRMALWRLDSLVAPVIAQENARPYFTYAPFYVAERAYNAMFAQWRSGEVLIPSNLLAIETPYVRLHFQLGPHGELASPQAPAGNMRDLAESMYVSTSRVSNAHAELDRLRREVDWAALRNSIDQFNQFVCANDLANGLIESKPRQNPSGNAEQGPAEANAADFRRRAEWTAQSQQAGKAGQSNIASAKAVREGWMAPHWSGDKLLLVRRVAVDNHIYLQGCWLNWPNLERAALDQIADVFPHARLDPVRNGESNPTAREMASLPVRLVPGDRCDAEAADRPTTRWTLLVAWVAALMAASAVAALVVGLISLGERRAAFVSAVTHELRTPLTTFRLYTDLLDRGIVSDPNRQAEYLQTMRTEADRLAHLVENVLAFSRLENSSAKSPNQTIDSIELLDRCWPRLQDRAKGANAVLRRDDADGAPVVVRTEPAVVEQILFNLVDNACKYGVVEKDASIAVIARRNGRQFWITVRDAGPGLSVDALRTLFRPFSKSAQMAAKTRPGVGLGLALCRRMARAVGGDLTYDASAESGASFTLRLPVESSSGRIRTGKS